MKKITYKIYTLGCKVNQYDSAKLESMLKQAGFLSVKNKANLAIINTCCVTKTAISKCKRMINKARKESPKAKIIITGCWPVVYYNEVKMLNPDIVFGINQFDILLEKIKSTKLQITNKSQSRNFGTKLQTRLKSRYFLKIQDGCEQFCTYCIIPYTRGKLKSRPMAEVVEEVKEAVRGGYKEIVVSGIHLGLYGKTHKTKNTKHKINLVMLLNRLIKIKNLGRIRLSSIEVTEVGDDLIKFIAESNKKICKHLHIPLQSGSNKILKLMNRPYLIKDYELRIKKIKNIITDIAITTDIIVGFPGETKKDFQDTYNFVKKIKFSRLHVFPFSAHEKTPAYKLSNKVDKKKIDERAKKLRELGEKLEKEYRRKFIGKELEIVVEDTRGDKVKGKTEYYFDLNINKFRKKQNLLGQIIKIRTKK
ncbi:MAG: tRNA (N(6)-L-threonylcarbamoyladenosine(37)-C(2))-methylthiotransferase MtaB [Patescibacteria group bacterium]